jgi:hypothetical protein
MMVAVAVYEGSLANDAVNVNVPTPGGVNSTVLPLVLIDPSDTSQTTSLVEPRTIASNEKLSALTKVIAGGLMLMEGVNKASPTEAAAVFCAQTGFPVIKTSNAHALRKKLSVIPSARQVWFAFSTSLTKKSSNDVRFPG